MVDHIPSVQADIWKEEGLAGRGLHSPHPCLNHKDLIAA